MASASVTLAAAGKLADRPPERLWVDGPICSKPEIKAWEMELEDLLLLVATVERAAPNPAAAAQWLRRLFYSTPLAGAGPRFDRLIRLDPLRSGQPVTTRDTRQAVLDALVRVTAVRTGAVSGPASSLNLVEISHLFVLLDLRLNGRGALGEQIANWAVGPNQPESVGSWAGDLASAWIAFNDAKSRARKAAGGPWKEPVVTPADLARPIAFLEQGIRGRAPLDDLLGDMDAVVVSNQALPSSPTPLAGLLAEYYAPGHSSGTTARVADRFPLFVTRAVPTIPHAVSSTGVVSLGPTAKDRIRAIIEDAVFWFLLGSRSGEGKMKAVVKAGGVWDDLGSPWGARMLEELAERFTAFLTDGLAGRPPKWLDAPPKTVEYPGMEVPPDARIDDLEALAQFHLNWRRPHQSLREIDRVLRPLSLHDPQGSGAVVVSGATPGTTRIMVEPFVDLREVMPVPGSTSEHRDLLRLDADTGRAGKAYRIVDVNHAARTLTVEGTPRIAGPSDWRVLRRPRLVLVDPFDGRAGGVGNLATGVGATWVGVAATTDLDRVVANFDTLFLPDDRHRTSRTYRIVAVDPVAARVQLDDAPYLASDSPTYRLPAGAAAATQDPKVLFTPTPSGCDHYDGALFVVYDNWVKSPGVRFTSYSSVVNASDPVTASSVVGNARYAVRSLRSPEGDDSADRNYELTVTDPDKVGNDEVAEAAFFLDGVTASRRPPPAPNPPAPTDPDGKTNLRIHIGNAGGAGAGTQGDLVSPSYYDLRALLVRLHQAERALLGLAEDPDLEAIAAAKTHADSVALYNGTAGATVADAGWTGRLAYELLLVRPDLRPIS
jgi:hypothetical protein